MKDITIEVLKAIRSDLGAFRSEVNKRFDDVDARFDLVDARFEGVDARFEGVDARFDNMARQQVESEVRIATELVAVAGALNQLNDSLRAEAVRDQLRDHEARLHKLESRTG